MNKDEFSSSRAWAEINHGDDSVIDAYEFKVLEIQAAEFERRAAYHTREAEKCRKRMEELGDTFVISGPTDDSPPEEILF